jgi:conjugal transfer pilin signal peptidase TrbI
MSKRLPLHLFLLKAVPLTAVLSIGAYYLADRYSVGVDPQKNTCLPWRVFIVDKHDKSVNRGEIFAFRSTSMDPFFKDGTQVIKVVEGVPGDRVTVTKSKVTVNGNQVGEGLLLSKKIRKQESRFVRDEFVPDNSFWFMGRTKDSFDSRYWGYVPKDQIVGKAYPLW